VSFEIFIYTKGQHLKSRIEELFNDHGLKFMPRSKPEKEKPTSNS
jgi:hypothetical protein